MWARKPTVSTVRMIAHPFTLVDNTKTVGVSMNKGVKFRAYPNKEQQNLINRTLGCCRLIYNKGLAMRNDAYSNGEKIGYNQTSAMLTDLKKQAEHCVRRAGRVTCLERSSG